MPAVTLAIIEKGHLMSKKLFVHRIVVGSALAAGVGLAGMIGAGTASAAPGISYDPGPGDPIGIGDNSATGAQANASNDNQALAISLFRPASGYGSWSKQDWEQGVRTRRNGRVPKRLHETRIPATMTMWWWQLTGPLRCTVSGPTCSPSAARFRTNPIATYPDGSQAFEYSQALSTFPVIVPNTVVAACGQRLAGNGVIFEVSGNACLS